MLQKSAWNRQLLSLFVKEAKEVAKSFRDGRFDENVAWKGLFKERLYRIYRQEIQARLKPGESHEDRVFRLATDYEKEKERTAQTGSLHIVSIDLFSAIYGLTMANRSTKRGLISQPS